MADSFAPTLGYDNDALAAALKTPSYPAAPQVNTGLDLSGMPGQSDMNAAGVDAAAKAGRVAGAAPSVVKPTPSDSFGMKQGVGAVLAGIQGSDQAGQSTDTQSGILRTLLSGASGAAGGAVVGGPVGAVVGGATGLVAGGLQAWMGVSDANEQAAAQKAYQDEMYAREKAKADQERKDQLSQLSYNRKEYEQGKVAEQYDKVMKAIQDRAAASDTFRTRFAQTGYIR